MAARTALGWAGVPVGLAAGFVGAGLAAEPVEEAFGFPVLPAAKVLALLLFSGGAAWLGARRRERADGPLWTAASVATPAWLFAATDGFAWLAVASTAPLAAWPFLPAAGRRPTFAAAASACVVATGLLAGGPALGEAARGDLAALAAGLLGAAAAVALAALAFRREAAAAAS